VYTVEQHQATTVETICKEEQKLFGNIKFGGLHLEDELIGYYILKPNALLHYDHSRQF